MSRSCVLRHELVFLLAAARSVAALIQSTYDSVPRTMEGDRIWFVDVHLERKRLVSTLSLVVNIRPGFGFGPRDESCVVWISVDAIIASITANIFPSQSVFKLNSIS